MPEPDKNDPVELDNIHKLLKYLIRVTLDDDLHNMLVKALRRLQVLRADFDRSRKIPLTAHRHDDK